MIEQTRVIFTVQSRNDSKMILRVFFPVKLQCVLKNPKLYKPLDAVEKQRYTEKLLGLTRDPYVAPRDAFA